MDITETMQAKFDASMTDKTFTDLLTALTAGTPDIDNHIDDNRKAYVGDHEILRDTNRRDKQVGDDQKTRRTVKHAKEVITLQKRIVNSAVEFLFGEPVTLTLKTEGQEKALELITNSWHKNRLDYFNKRLSRDLFVEGKAAEVWEIPPTSETKKAKRARVTLLSKRTGYSIYPHFDAWGDMDAFTIKYQNTNPEGKIIERVTIYTADKRITAVKNGPKWEKEEVENILKIIPVVYYEQGPPEWDGVDTEIDRMEYLLSNFADTNDYFGAPIIELKGVVSNMPKKEDSGKVITVQAETDPEGKVYYPGGASFVTWEQGPESIEKEYTMLKDIVFGQTSTPDLSFSNVKGMTGLSGIAIRLMFSDALFKAKDKQEIFGPGLDRRISVMKAILGVVDVSQAAALNKTEVEIIFGDVLPTDITALINSLSVARMGEPIMSEKSAVEQNPLVTDPEADLEEMGKERTAAAGIAGSFNVE